MLSVAKGFSTHVAAGELVVGNLVEGFVWVYFFKLPLQTGVANICLLLLLQSFFFIFLASALASVISILLIYSVAICFDSCDYSQGFAHFLIFCIASASNSLLPI